MSCAHVRMHMGTLFRLTISSFVVGTTVSVGLLNWKATTEGAGHGSVAASDSANITRGCTNAVEVIRHLHVDSEVGSLGLREAVCAGNVVGDLKLDEVGCCVAGNVEITLVRAGAISIDLVDGDSELRALLDGRHLVGCDGLLGFTSNIDVAVDLCSAAGVHNVLRDLAISDDGGVLLARADASTVTSQRVVDFEPLALTRLSDG